MMFMIIQKNYDEYHDSKNKKKPITTQIENENSVSSRNNKSKNNFNESISSNDDENRYQIPKMIMLVISITNDGITTIASVL